jgi:hypothetical protein
VRRSQQLAEPVAGTHAVRGRVSLLSSRSVDTDYYAVRNVDGTEGALLVPIAAGAGITYSTQRIHGLGPPACTSRRTSATRLPTRGAARVRGVSGYWRPASTVDVYLRARRRCRW